MFPQIQPNKKRWLARKIIPLAQQGTVTDNPPFTHRARTQALASIVDAWSLVVAIPLFVFVGVQDNVTLPPLVDPTIQTTIHANWPPPAWDTQTTRKFTQGTAAIPSIPPGTDQYQFPIGQWPQPDWPTQRAPFTSEKASSFDPPKVVFDKPDVVGLWPLLEWPTQVTRKAPISPVGAPPLAPHRAFVEIDRWSTVVPIPLWQTFGTQSSTPAVNNPPPTNNNIDALVGTWSQPAWDTQVTRKTPIPNVPAVPFSRVAFQGIDRWDSLSWDTQTTRKTPIASVAPQVDNPPPRTISYPIYDRWFNRPTQGLWQTLGYYNGPTVGPADNPPPKRYPWDVIGVSWIERPLQAVWMSRIIDLSVPNLPTRAWLPMVLESWHLSTPFYQPKRPVVTPSGVLVIDNPPFSSRRPQLPAYDANWPQPAWPAQRTPFLVQPGVDLPPISVTIQRRHLDVITRMWETIPDVQQRRPQAIPQAIVFRRTLSQFGTGVGHRQPHGWT